MMLINRMHETAMELEEMRYYHDQAAVELEETKHRNRTSAERAQHAHNLQLLDKHRENDRAKTEDERENMIIAIEAERALSKIRLDEQQDMLGIEDQRSKNQIYNRTVGFFAMGIVLSLFAWIFKALFRQG